MAISTAFFEAFSSVSVFYFGLEAINHNRAKGKDESMLPQADHECVLCTCHI
jgi:hypothetical protein